MANKPTTEPHKPVENKTNKKNKQKEQTNKNKQREEYSSEDHEKLFD